MARYRAVAKPARANDYIEDRVMQPLGHPTVFVGDPVNTGVLDANGNPIYRFPDAPGFVRNKSEEK